MKGYLNNKIYDDFPPDLQVMVDIRLDEYIYDIYTRPNMIRLNRYYNNVYCYANDRPPYNYCERNIKRDAIDVPRDELENMCMYECLRCNDWSPESPLRKNGLCTYCLRDGDESYGMSCDEWREWCNLEVEPVPVWMFLNLKSLP